MKYQEDNYYIDRILSGDVSSYAFLVSKHKSLVFTIALKILNNREDAEEVAQDTFLKAYQSLKSFEGKSKFSTWLYRIAYNAAISKTRKKKLEFTGMDDTIIANYSTDEIKENTDRLDENLQMKLVEEAMKRLPADDHLLMTLFYKEENSIEEISYITGYTVSNVKVKLHRIRKRMYEEIRLKMEAVRQV
jgi:RNA polymerase sigma factor (sigma-70 family)